jgi:hypothetical protein
MGLHKESRQENLIVMCIGGRARQKFDLEIFDVRNLVDVEAKEKCQVKISNRFAALENR